MPIGANSWLYNSRIQHSCSPSDSLPALSVNGVALKVDKYKHLCIWITSNLSWSKQVTKVGRKARQKVGILFRKNYQHTSTSTLLKLYLSSIRPDLEYAVAVWSPYQKCLWNQSRRWPFESVPGSGILTTTLSMPDTTFPVYLKHGCSYDSAFCLMW